MMTSEVRFLSKSSDIPTSESQRQQKAMIGVIQIYMVRAAPLQKEVDMLQKFSNELL